MWIAITDESGSPELLNLDLCELLYVKRTEKEWEVRADIGGSYVTMRTAPTKEAAEGYLSGIAGTIRAV